MPTESISPEELDKKESYSPEELDKMEGVQNIPNQVQNPGFDFGKMIHNVPSSAMNLVRSSFAPTALYDLAKPGVEEAINKLRHPESPNPDVMKRVSDIGSGLAKPFLHPETSMEDDPIGTVANYAGLGEGMMKGGKAMIHSPVAGGITKMAGGAGAAALGHPYIGSGLAMGGLKDIGKALTKKVESPFADMQHGEIEAHNSQQQLGQHTIPKVPKFQDLPTPNSTPIIQWHPETPKPRIDTIPKTPIIQDLPAARNPLGAESHQPSTPSPREVSTRQVQPLTPKPPEVPDTRVSTSRLMVRPPAGIQGPLENLPNFSKNALKSPKLIEKGEIIKPGSKNSKYDITSVVD